MPRDRARRRRGHAHALGAAEGAARDRRAHAAGACAGGGDAGRLRATSRWWSGPTTTRVADEAQRVAPTRRVFEQRERRGTAHAVLAARKRDRARRRRYPGACSPTRRWCARETLTQLRAALAQGAAVAVLGFRPADPAGYGRLLTQGGELARHPRGQRRQRRRSGKIGFCNGGLMALAGRHALALLERIGNANAKGEYYLTDAVAIAREMGLKAVAIETEEDDVRGINTKAQLAEAEAVLQQRLRAAAMEAGVTLIAPETVFLSRRHQIRQGRHGRAECRVRPGRHGRGRRDDPLVLASRRRACRQGRARRAICAAAAGRRSRRRRAHRQFRRGEGGRRSRPAPRPIISPISATRASARAPISAPAPSPAIMTAWPSTAPTSAKAPSSARIPRWSRRSRSATAPISAPAR